LYASVIVPNGNGRHHLAACLGSLGRQRIAQDFEILLVDNHSTDDSIPYVRANFPNVRIVPLAWNGVFAGAVNAGLRIARGEYIVLLNNDAEADPDWLAELLRQLESTPEAGMAASKILLWDRRDALHSAGDFYGFDGIPGNRGVWGIDDGRFDDDHLIFGACAGAAAYRRTLFESIGLLDDSLVAYCEDVDLNLRAHLAGWQCVYAPRARIYHRLSATGGGPLASYSCGRNFIVVALRDLPAPILRRHGGTILVAQLRIAAEALLHLGEPAARARLRGQFAGLRAIPRAWAQRPGIHSGSVIPWHALESWLALRDRPTAGG